MSKGSGWPLYLMAALMLACSLYIAWNMSGLRSSMEVQEASMETQRDLVAELVAKENKDMLYTGWTSGGPTNEYHVETTCREAESEATCLERHESMVAAFQKLHRPD